MNTEIAKVPEFTADDYTNTSAPYEWLYQYKDDKFMLQQMIQRMKKQAGSVGVRCFVSLWNAYTETVAAQQGMALDNSTQFERQPLELYSGQYRCDDYGVTIADKWGYEQVVCRHPIMPVQRLINIDTGEERLRIAYKKGSTWRSIVVEKTVLASSSSILQLAANGIMVNSENAKALSTYLLELEQLNYDQIPELRSVGRLGWVGDHGFSPYVDDLEFDGENNYKHIFAAVKQSGDEQKWLDAMLDLRATKAPGRLFLAASFASVILDSCGVLPFFLHAWGGTEVGKTVGLMIAASVWASPRMGDYISTFNTTTVGQEMTASFLNSLPMCIDELQIQSSAGIKDFDRMIYQLTEGVGRTRGARSGGLQKIATWKNCIITNGEHPITNSSSGGGAVNRILEFECSEPVYHDLVGMCAVIQNNYGFAGRKFVEYLQQPGATERVVRIQQAFYHELLNYDSMNKQAAAASAILAADSIATEIIFKDQNELSIDDVASIMTRREEVNVNARALEYVYELVERNPNRFSRNDHGDYTGEVWGKLDDYCVYIIKSVFDRELSAVGFNSTAFLSWAKRCGATICDTGKRTKKARITGSSTNCVCLKLDFEGTEGT